MTPVDGRLDRALDGFVDTMTWRFALIFIPAFPLGFVFGELLRHLCVR